MIIKRYFARFLVLCLTGLMPMILLAAPSSWQIIPAESHLGFTATQNGAPVSGEFKTFRGEIVIDPDNIKTGHIEIVVDINSVSASYADLKQTLTTADWFNAKLFPTAVFKASEFKQTGKNSYEAIGTLRIRDKSAPATLVFHAEEPVPEKRVVTGSTSIKRSTFGVGQGEWAGTDQVKDEVSVNFKVVAVKK